MKSDSYGRTTGRRARQRAMRYYLCSPGFEADNKPILDSDINDRLCRAVPLYRDLCRKMLAASYRQSSPIAFSSCLRFIGLLLGKFFLRSNRLDFQLEIALLRAKVASHHNTHCCDVASI